MKMTEEEKKALESEEKEIRNQIYGGKSEAEYTKWMQTLSPEEINKELARLKEIQPKIKELARKQGKLFQFYLQGIFGFFRLLFYTIYLYLPSILLNGFQTFLLIEKIFELHPFGHLSWGMILLPSIVDIGFRTYDLYQKDQSK